MPSMLATLWHSAVMVRLVGSGCATITCCTVVRGRTLTSTTGECKVGCRKENSEFKFGKFLWCDVETSYAIRTAKNKIIILL